MKILGFNITRSLPEPELKRSYKAAISNRLNADWIFSPFSASSEIRGNLSAMRSRSRELERNDPIMESFLAAVENNVIGPDGMTLQMKITERSGGQDVLDDRANLCIETHWERFCRPENFCVTGIMSAAEIQRIIARSAARDGEILIRFVRGFQHSEYEFAIQLFESDQLDDSYSIDLGNGKRIDQGIELDEWGRHIAYHILTQHPGEIYAGAPSTYRQRIPATELVLVNLQKRVGETRSAPWFSSVAMMMKMLDGYQEAEVVAARAAAGKMAFAVTDGSEATKYTGEQATDGGKYMDAAAGTIEQLPPGLKIEAFDPQHPTSQFPAFYKSILRNISSGLHVSYNMLANDLEGVNYSSLREGKLTEQDHWKKLQNWFATRVMRRIFSEWLAWSLATGKITDLDTGTPLPATKLAKFDQPQFRGRRWPWVDPVKDMQAMETARANGWISDSDIIESQGRDIEDVCSQIKSDTELQRKFGVDKINIQSQKETKDAETDTDTSAKL